MEAGVRLEDGCIHITYMIYLHICLRYPLLILLIPVGNLSVQDHSRWMDARYDFPRRTPLGD